MFICETGIIWKRQWQGRNVPFQEKHFQGLVYCSYWFSISLGSQVTCCFFCGSWDLTWKLGWEARNWAGEDADQKGRLGDEKLQLNSLSWFSSKLVTRETHVHSLYNFENALGFLFYFFLLVLEVGFAVGQGETGRTWCFVCPSAWQHQLILV